MTQLPEQAIQTRFLAKGWTLSVAESCTGGALAARLTRQPGASNYFSGGIVSYSNQLKHTLLGVPTDLIDTYGAVSQQVVASMAEGILTCTGTDVGIAVSGIAGPTGGSRTKPVGTVWAALMKKGEKPYCWCLQLEGERTQIIEKAVEAILQQLLTFS
jgi:PncC family amidohydrolase